MNTFLNFDLFHLNSPQNILGTAYVTHSTVTGSSSVTVATGSALR